MGGPGLEYLESKNSKLLASSLYNFNYQVLCVL